MKISNVDLGKKKKSISGFIFVLIWFLFVWLFFCFWFWFFVVVVCFVFVCLFVCFNQVKTPAWSVYVGGVNGGQGRSAAVELMARDCIWL